MNTMNQLKCLFSTDEDRKRWKTLQAEVRDYPRKRKECTAERDALKHVKHMHEWENEDAKDTIDYLCDLREEAGAFHEALSLFLNQYGMHVVLMRCNECHKKKHVTQNAVVDERWSALMSQDFWPCKGCSEEFCGDCWVDHDCGCIDDIIDQVDD